MQANQGPVFANLTNNTEKTSGVDAGPAPSFKLDNGKNLSGIPHASSNGKLNGISGSSSYSKPVNEPLSIDSISGASGLKIQAPINQVNEFSSSGQSSDPEVIRHTGQSIIAPTPKVKKSILGENDHLQGLCLDSQRTNPVSSIPKEQKVNEDLISTKILIQGQTNAFIGDKPNLHRSIPLPDFAFSHNVPDDFNIQLGTSISYLEAANLAKQHLVGETYNSGRRYVTIEDIELFGQEDKLVINVLLSGSYTGSVYMVGRPVYNLKKNQIDSTLILRIFI